MVPVAVPFYGRLCDATPSLWGSGARLFRHCGLVFGCLIFTGPVLAQQATFHDSLLDHLAGHWILDGMLAGRHATHDVSADWVLEHQYLEFHEVARDKKKDGEPAYEARVFIGWDQSLHEYVCVWLDDFGDISTQSLGHARRVAESIPFVFQDTADSGKFHTTFVYDPARDTWVMNMDQDKAGKLSPFARMSLTRAH